jgi:hypothetical protein
MTKKWMSKVREGMIKKGTVGSFRRFVYNKYSSKGFTSDGKIKLSIINKEKNNKSLRIRRMATLAKNFRR